MGSCVSVHKDPGSSIRLRFSIGSKNDKLLISSPVKDKSVTVNAGDLTPVTSLRSPAPYTTIGSNDEAYFDSQPWLESDCEDDFVSVNGDFLSSRGSTPVHPNSSLGKVNKLVLEEEGGNDSVPQQPSPPDRKKRLSELFKESLRNEDEYDEEDKSAADRNTTLAQQLKSTTGTTPYLSRANSEGSTHPNGVLGKEEKPLRSPQCCLPKMISSRSLNDRRKRASPARAG